LYFSNILAEAIITMVKLYNKNIIRNTTKVNMKVEETFNGVEF